METRPLAIIRNSLSLRCAESSFFRIFLREFTRDQGKCAIEERNDLGPLCHSNGPIPANLDLAAPHEQETASTRRNDEMAGAAPREKSVVTD